MNWHEPLITPAMAFYCFIGVIVIDVLYLVVRKAMKEGSSPDPLSEPHGDVVNVGRHPLGPQS